MAARRIKRRKLYKKPSKLREGKTRVSPITKEAQVLKKSRWNNRDTHRDPNKSKAMLRKTAITAGIIAGGAAVGFGLYAFAHGVKIKLPTTLFKKSAAGIPKVEDYVSLGKVHPDWKRVIGKPVPSEGIGGWLKKFRYQVKTKLWQQREHKQVSSLVKSGKDKVVLETVDIIKDASPKTLKKAWFDWVGYKNKIGGTADDLYYTMKEAIANPVDDKVVFNKQLGGMQKFLSSSKATKKIDDIIDFVKNIEIGEADDKAVKKLVKSLTFKSSVKQEKALKDSIKLLMKHGDKVSNEHAVSYLLNNYASILYKNKQVAASADSFLGAAGTVAAGGFLAGSLAIPSWEHTRKELSQSGKYAVMRGASYGITRTEAALIKRNLLGAREDRTTVIL